MPESSLPQLIAQRNGPLSLVAPKHLPQWLPRLMVPRGWLRTGSGALATTRMTLRRVGTTNFWDGCETLNLYRVPGQIPPDVLFANADRALRDGGARNIATVAVQTPPAYRTITARVTGDLVIEPRPLWAQYTYYVVQSEGGTALIEQAILIGRDVMDALMPEVERLTGSVYRALLRSIDQGRVAR